MIVLAFGKLRALSLVSATLEIEYATQCLLLKQINKTIGHLAFSQNMDLSVQSNVLSLDPSSASPRIPTNAVSSF